MSHPDKPYRSEEISPVADEEVSCPCPGPRFCALSGAAALPDQEKEYNIVVEM